MAANNSSLTNQLLEFEVLVCKRTKRRVLCLSYTLPGTLGMSFPSPYREHDQQLHRTRVRAEFYWPPHWLEAVCGERQRLAARGAGKQQG